MGCGFRWRDPKPDLHASAGASASPLLYSERRGVAKLHRDLRIRPIGSVSGVLILAPGAGLAAECIALEMMAQTAGAIAG